MQFSHSFGQVSANTIIFIFSHQNRKYKIRPIENELFTGQQWKLSVSNVILMRSQIDRAKFENLKIYNFITLHDGFEYSFIFSRSFPKWSEHLKVSMYGRVALEP